MLTTAAFLALLLWSCVALAQLGVFRPIPIGLAAAASLTVAVAACARAGGRAPLNETPRPVPARLLLLAGALALAASLPVADATLWQSDATAYLNLAHQLRVHGTLVFDDPVLEELRAAGAEEALLNLMPGDVTGRAARFPGGFRVVGRDPARVTAPFAPGTVVALALAAGTGIPRAAEHVPTAFALLSALTLLLLATRLLDVRLGLLVVATLVAALPQVWFSRLPAAEILAQWLVLAGLLALWPTNEKPAVRQAVLGGMLLGVATLVKAELLPVLGVALVWWLLWGWEGPDRPGTRRPTQSAVALGFGLPALHALAVYSLSEGHYADLFSWLLERAPGAAALGLFAALLAGALLIPALRVAAPWLFAGACAALYLWVAGPASGLPGLGVLVATVTAPVAVALLVGPAVGGWAAFAWRPELRRWWGLALAILTGSLVLWVANPWEAGDPLWVSRRFVPAVLPLSLLALAVGLDRALAGLRPAGRALGLLLAFGAALALMGHRSVRSGAMAGGPRTSEQLHALRARLPAEARLLVGPELAGTHVATSLSYLADRPSVLLPPPQQPVQWIRPLLGAWLQRDHEVLLLIGESVVAGAADLNLYAPEMTLTPTSTHELRALHPSPRNRTAAGGAESHVVAHLLSVRPARRSVAAVDIGAWPQDLLHDLRGFHAPEADAGAPTGSFRWTRSAARLRLPRGVGVRLWLAADRPPPAPAARLSVWIDGGAPRGEARELPGGLTEITLPTAGNDDSVLVLLAVNTFNPARLGISDDARDLGVRLFQVEILRR